MGKTGNFQTIAEDFLGCGVEMIHHWTILGQFWDMQGEVVVLHELYVHSMGAVSEQ